MDPAFPTALMQEDRRAARAARGVRAARTPRVANAARSPREPASAVALLVLFLAAWTLVALIAGPAVGQVAPLASRTATASPVAGPVAASVAPGAAPASDAATHAHAAPPAEAVVDVGLTVSDLDRSVAFFRDVLDFRLESVREETGAAREALEGVFGLRMRAAVMQLGGESIELTEYLAPEGRPIPADSASNDRWFQHVAIVVSDMGRAYERLRAHRVRHASSGPQRLPDWNPNAGGIEAFYFKDADGHVLEVIAFPEGKGDPKWQRLAAGPDAPLFLGIDHTAIVVDDTERSLAFWRDGLGLRVAGESENWGTEQEHLNNVFGARLRITGLRAASGPGVEFLEYLAPSGGRPYPADAAANDLAHWETRVAVRDLPAVLARLRAARRISAGPVTLPGGGHAILLRDPDGHAVELHAAEP